MIVVTNILSLYPVLSLYRALHALNVWNGGTKDKKEPVMAWQTVCLLFLNMERVEQSMGFVEQRGIWGGVKLLLVA